MTDAQKTFELDEEEEEVSEEEERPTGIVQPKYKIVHTYPINIG